MQDAGGTWIAGVDGGGSGCRAVLADAAGRVLGRGTAGPANATTDRVQTCTNVRAALDGALAEAGLGAEALAQTRIVAGLAGVIAPTLAHEVQQALDLPHITVTEDLDIAVAGALGGRAGVVAIVGTGCNLAALRDGRLRRIGGWGLVLGDQASGAWLGRALWQEALLRHDGLAPHTALSHEVWGAYGNDPAYLIDAASRAQPRDFAEWAPRVFAARDAGDPLGAALVDRGAAYLAQAIDALGLMPGEVLCLAGGLGPRYADLLPEAHRAHLSAPAGDAVDGALRLARLGQGATVAAGDGP